MRHLENVFQMSWRHLCKKFWRRFGKVLKTSWRRMTKANMFVLIKTSWKRLEDVFWRCVTKANIFVLIKMSWRRLEEVFWRQGRKTSSRCLHDVFTKTNTFFFFYIYDTKFKQENKICNHQVLQKFVYTWEKNKNSEINTSTKINKKNVLAIVL